MPGPYKPIRFQTGLKPKWIILSLVLVIIISVVIYQIFDFQQANTSEEDTIIIVTTDFGKNVILNEIIPYNQTMSAMDALKSVADVETTYGGGFVDSINGIKSAYNSGQGEPKDWFYSINGMLASVGALEYTMHPGDIMRWDFHDWSLDRITTCVVADYPEPFLHGHGGNVPSVYVVDTGGYEGSSNSLIDSLEGYGIDANYRTTGSLAQSEKKNGNLILIGDFDNEMISEMNSNYDRMGWFFQYSNDEVRIHDFTGETIRVLDRCGIIAAAQNPWNDKGTWNGENVVWVCTGVTNDNVENAVALLIEHPEELSNSFSVGMHGDEVFGVP